MQGAIWDRNGEPTLKTDSSITWKNRDPIKRGWAVFDIRGLSKAPGQYSEVWLDYDQITSDNDQAYLCWPSHLADEAGAVAWHNVKLASPVTWLANIGAGDTVVVIGWIDVRTGGMTPEEGTAGGRGSQNPPLLILKP
jgi:hypothetical protein